jgi:hypothetical protein
MLNHIWQPTLLAMGIAVILAVPIGVGVLRAQQPAARGFAAQKASNRSFSVATIKPSRPDEDGGAVFEELKSQLGLKAESTRGPVRVIVIDSAELPGQN